MNRRDDLIAIHLSRMVASEFVDPIVKRDIQTWFHAQEPLLDRNGLVEILADEYRKSGNAGLIPSLRAGTCGAANLAAMERVRDAVYPGTVQTFFATQIQTTSKKTGDKSPWYLGCILEHSTMDDAVMCNEKVYAMIKAELDRNYSAFDVSIRIQKFTIVRSDETVEEERPVT